MEEAAPEALELLLNVFLLLKRVLLFVLEMLSGITSWVLTAGSKVLSHGRDLWAWLLEAVPLLYYNLCALLQVIYNAIFSTITLVVYLVQQGWGVAKVVVGGAGRGLAILWSLLGKLYTSVLAVLSTMWDAVLFIILTVFKLLVTLLTLVFNTVRTLLKLVGLPWMGTEIATLPADRDRHKSQDWKPQEQWQYLFIVTVVTATVLLITFWWKIVPVLVTYWRRLKGVMFHNAQPQAHIRLAPHPAQHNQPPPRFRHQHNQQQNMEQQQNAQRQQNVQRPIQHHYQLRGPQRQVAALQPQPDVQLQRRALGVEEARDVQRLQQELDQRRLCIVCQDNEREMMLKPCNHFCVCGECVRLLRGTCPVCRVHIQCQERVFT